MGKKEVKKSSKKTKSKNKQTYFLFKSSGSTIGQKAADKLTIWAGSWSFILVFLLIIVVWIAVNIYAWVGEWDPYPFILLNLVLSCLAAIQAPIILMSQNRQTQRDRLKSEYDYRIDKKAEREIQEIKKLLQKYVEATKK
ncbi:MAG: DUF1003 domain-containing protein [archaeon]